MASHLLTAWLLAVVLPLLVATRLWGPGEHWPVVTLRATLASITLVALTVSFHSWWLPVAAGTVLAAFVLVRRLPSGATPASGLEGRDGQEALGRRRGAAARGRARADAVGPTHRRSPWRSPPRRAPKRRRPARSRLHSMAPGKPTTSLGSRATPPDRRPTPPSAARSSPGFQLEESERWQQSPERSGAERTSSYTARGAPSVDSWSRGSFAHEDRWTDAPVPGAARLAYEPAALESIRRTGGLGG